MRNASGPFRPARPVARQSSRHSRRRVTRQPRPRPKPWGKGTSCFFRLPTFSLIPTRPCEPLARGAIATSRINVAKKSSHGPQKAIRRRGFYITACFPCLSAPRTLLGSLTHSLTLSLYPSCVQSLTVTVSRGIRVGQSWTPPPRAPRFVGGLTRARAHAYKAGHRAPPHTRTPQPANPIVKQADIRPGMGDYSQLQRLYPDRERGGRREWARMLGPTHPEVG